LLGRMPLIRIAFPQPLVFPDDQHPPSLAALSKLNHLLPLIKAKISIELLFQAFDHRPCENFFPVLRVVNPRRPPSIGALSRFFTIISDKDSKAQVASDPFFLDPLF